MAERKATIGTRGSRLALWQSEYVKGLIQTVRSDLAIDIKIVRTEGDRDRATSLAAMGGMGVFTKTIETQLLSGEIDVAVHSAKDLPAAMTQGLVIGAVPKRAPVEDVAILAKVSSVADLPTGAVVGTGSPRRGAQLLNQRPDLKIADIRGNVGTRLEKLQTGQYDALLMARAGLVRLGMDEVIGEIFDPETFIPAPGQGALLIQCRADDDFVRQFCRMINHAESRRCLSIERALLRRLNAGCSAAVGGWARIVDDRVVLSAVVLDKDGRKRLFAMHDISCEAPDETLLDRVAGQLLKDGAEELIRVE